jgi:hypothetical protein
MAEVTDEMHGRHLCCRLVCADGTSLNGHAGGTTVFGTNPGGKYINRGGATLGTNPGGKYVYSDSGAKFRTNPGGKYHWYGSSP